MSMSAARKAASRQSSRRAPAIKIFQIYLFKILRCRALIICLKKKNNWGELRAASRKLPHLSETSPLSKKISSTALSYCYCPATLLAKPASSTPKRAMASRSSLVRSVWRRRSAYS